MIICYLVLAAVLFYASYSDVRTLTVPPALWLIPAISETFYEIYEGNIYGVVVFFIMAVTTCTVSAAMASYMARKDKKFIGGADILAMLCVIYVLKEASWIFCLTGIMSLLLDRRVIRKQACAEGNAFPLIPYITAGYITTLLISHFI